MSGSGLDGMEARALPLRRRVELLREELEGFRFSRGSPGPRLQTPFAAPANGGGKRSSGASLVSPPPGAGEPRAGALGIPPEVDSPRDAGGGSFPTRPGPGPGRWRRSWLPPGKTIVGRITGSPSSAPVRTNPEPSWRWGWLPVSAMVALHSVGSDPVDGGLEMGPAPPSSGALREGGSCSGGRPLRRGVGGGGPGLRG